MLLALISAFCLACYIILYIFMKKIKPMKPYSPLKAMVNRVKLYFYFGLLLILTGSMIFVSCQSPGVVLPESQARELRAPAYPLVTIDPYISAWSATDQLFDSPVRHWTGRVHPLTGAIRVDGEIYRFLGQEEPQWEPILPLASRTPWEGDYTLAAPTGEWTAPGYDPQGWMKGKAAFGTLGMPNLATPWETEDIWVRRVFQIDTAEQKEVYLIYSHDDIFELYLNGTQLVGTGYEWKNNVVLKIDKNLLKPGADNVIAAHCHNRTGGGYVDFGLFKEVGDGPVFATTAVQKSVAMSPTHTRYLFTCGPVDLEVRFISPLLPGNPDLLSRPVSYIAYQVQSNDGKTHDVQLYFEATPQWAVDHTDQAVEITRGETGQVKYLKAGTTEQPVLQKKGDDRRIDWGYFYMAFPAASKASAAISDYYSNKQAFAQNGTLGQGETSMVTLPSEKMAVMSIADPVGKVGAAPAMGYLMVGYDDIESIQYFGNNLKAWWKEDGQVTMDEALNLAVTEFDRILTECNEFDRQLIEEAVNRGGEKYADLVILAFRQSIAAHKLVRGPEGQMLFFSKENFSNGSIGTVDITYPSAPLYLKYNPALLKGMMDPIFFFSESGKWTKPFAAHDVGTYPLANGQTYGGDMPVEESGNMLILAAAIAYTEGNANYAEKHWETLTTWTNYLLEHGLDPENQLCTDDFAGHFAHNVNLSVKAILGIASYGYLAGMLEKNDIAEKYTSEAKKMAGQWMTMADDGDHYRLTFDQPGTWSQKYNLVWDKLMGWGIFPPEVAAREIAFYLTKQNTYGLPLDNRKTYTKSDWIVWTATLAGDKETFNRFIEPVHRYVSETPDRVPMSDWYETTNAEQVGFQARSVVGGYFIKMLEK